MQRGLVIVSVLALVALAVPADADWDDGQSAKWVRMPDLSDTGLDVVATVIDSTGRVLGDDFECRKTSPITDIHIWGSWLNDALPWEDSPNSVTFTLSIWSDLPAGPGVEYSRPLEMLWSKTFGPGQFRSRVWADGLSEGWYSPPGYYQPIGDTVCWQYNFYIDQDEAFVQQGAPDNPIIYWLVVQASPTDKDTRFGWKTTLQHWQDDAVWGSGAVPVGTAWYELRYPNGHPMAGESIDLAFALTDSSGYVIPDKDFGDAPDPYPTLEADDGARHGVDPAVFVNFVPDPEPDGQPHVDALGDDDDGHDDEYCDLIMGAVTEGEPTYMLLWASCDGYLDGWLDMRRDGDWDDPIDIIFNSEPLTAGWNLVSFLTPMPAIPGDSFARLRFSTTGGLLPTGLASDGEVEDFAVEILPSERYKWVRLPDPDTTGIDVMACSGYVLADDYRCKRPGRITEIDIWGSWYNDIYPPAGAGGAYFQLAIHEDIPATPTSHSMPGNVLWQMDFPPGSFTVRRFMPYIEEGWLEPPEDYEFPADWTMWLYTFDIDPDDAFHQVGMPDSHIVYWLSLQVDPAGGGEFGWKTSRRQWNDDAVWGIGGVPHPGPWYELVYPPGHEKAGESLDLAFGLRMTHGTGTPEDEVGDSSVLRQNVPNPFNPKTDIQYVLTRSGHVTLEIYDAAGHLVRCLVDETQDEGEQVVPWDGRNDEGVRMASGVYFYRLKTEATEETRKMVILK
jgi:hypothetical protein